MSGNERMGQIWPEFELDRVYINRTRQDDYQTTGEMLWGGKVVAVTLELPWRNNMPRVSCIPTGRYWVVRRSSPKYGNHFWLKNTGSRSYILIHSANYFYDLLGCIGVGEKLQDINRDGHLDLVNSRATMTRLLKTLPQEFDLIIT